LSNSKPPEPLVFFIDHSLGNKKVAEALRQQGVRAEVHEDHFPIDAKDEDWLPEVEQRGWVVLTKDDRIRYRPIERDALIRARVAMFVLASGNLRGEEMAQAFIAALPRIRRFLTKNRPPFIARVSRSGTVSLLFNGKD
jgi:predicted nuclease of predicted toxin-antitoxin system